MEYKGIELTEYKTTENVIFDPPKKMLVWDTNVGTPAESFVLAVLSGRKFPVITDITQWGHCAEIPKEELKPRRATKQEFARWIAQGKGEWKERYSDYAYLTWDAYCESEANEPCSEKIVARKWDDEQWHEPTIEYMGIKE